MRARLGGAVVLAAALVTALGSPSIAQPAPSEENAIPAALQRIGNNTYSAADISLIKQHPQIAAQVPDPQHSTSKKVHGTPKELSPTSAQERCHSVDDIRTRYSLLGSTIYNWHHYVEWCGSGDAVTQWGQRYDYVTDAQGIIYQRERTLDQKSPLPRSTATSHISRHMEYCVVRYGCYASTYPWSKLTLHPDGRTDRQGGAG